MISKKIEKISKIIDKKSPKILKYLQENGKWSPKELNVITKKNGKSL